MSNINFDFSMKEPYVSRDWVYKDISLPLELPTNGSADLKTNDDYDAIKIGIRNIFSFLPGQRILYPDFGNILYKYLYEPINSITSKNIKNEFTKMLVKWEPRISIIDLQVVPDEDHSQYNISLTYKVEILDNIEETITFPFKRLTYD